MTPLFNDSQYLQELSSCLIQNLAHLLETRPRDPIEYLAHSLKHYRRIHPRQAYTGQPTDFIAKKSMITSLVTVLDVDVSQLSVLSQVTKNTQAKKILITNTNESDLINEDNIVLKDKLFVHREFLADSAVVGDLFDDDDIS